LIGNPSQRSVALHVPAMKEVVRARIGGRIRVPDPKFKSRQIIADASRHLLRQPAPFRVIVDEQDDVGFGMAWRSNGATCGDGATQIGVAVEKFEMGRVSGAVFSLFFRGGFPFSTNRLPGLDVVFQLVIAVADAT